ncbi:MAG: imidazole glycerol phosphate synthase subunit HisH, partial [Proteobacteria bacterium]|nr:imidazole glycerol phosphate synthase subunit HisH [Pseudomonadota bacterium]
GKPLLGICLGMQLLFEKSYEGGERPGLSIIEGEVKKFPESIAREYKVPHMCWNKVSFRNVKSGSSAELNRIKNAIGLDPFFYFVHSYYVNTKSENIFLQCNYANVEFAAGVIKDNVRAFQFHPELSGPIGLNLLKTFIDI